MKAFMLFACLCLSVAPCYGATITARQMLKRGAVITASDIHIDLSPQETMADIEGQYVGQQLRRTVHAGSKITRANVTAPILVKRNEMVSVVYTYGAMQITAKGRALQAGAKGDIITVLNISSRKKISGIVLASSMVEAGR